MALLRNHTQGFTIVNSEILKNQELKMKDRGLLITLLSLPDNWDFSIEGLCAILPDGKAAIRTSLQVLEEMGYIVRRRLRNEQGQLTGTEWEVYDTPQKKNEPEPAEPEEKKTAINERQLMKKKSRKQTSKIEKKPPKCENRTLVETTENRMVEPKSDFPTLENRTQYNTNTTLELQIDKSNINLRKRDKDLPVKPAKEKEPVPEALSPSDYDLLVNEFSREEVDFQISKIRQKGYANCMNVATIRKWCTDKRKGLALPQTRIPGSGVSFANFKQRTYDFNELEASLLRKQREVPG